MSTEIINEEDGRVKKIFEDGEISTIKICDESGKKQEIHFFSETEETKRINAAFAASKLTKNVEERSMEKQCKTR